jgi:hypothetical protein
MESVGRPCFGHTGLHLYLKLKLSFHFYCIFQSRDAPVSIWAENELDRVQVEKNLRLFFNFYFTWCVYCAVLDGSRSLTDDTVCGLGKSLTGDTVCGHR